MILVAGLGQTGQSVLRYLRFTQQAAYGFDTRESFDLSTLQEDFSDTQFAVGEIPKSWLKSIQTVVLSPGISVREPWVLDLQAKGAQVIGDIELFARAVGAPVVAITGSNGKSTVTTLVGMALTQAGYKVAMGGNIGVPALDLLSDDEEYEVYVLELSSFQLETTYSLHTVSSVLLNLSEDHMDRYDDMNAYLQAKLNVFNDTHLAICPADMDCASFRLQGHRSFGLDVPQSPMDYGVVTNRKGTYLAIGNMPLVEVSKMRLQGKHHMLNALAMMALCEPFRVAPEDFKKVLMHFSGLPHRTQPVAEHHGILWINDSKGTNVGATLTAIESIGGQISGKLILLAGGVGKDAEFEALAPAVTSYAKKAILFGRDRQQIADCLPAGNVELVDTLQEAILEAKSLAESGDAVLFSPACASFDQFDSYVHRGDCFARWVQELVVDANE